MRRYLLVLIAFLFSMCIHAQTNSAEAKAAYLLAEESYGKGDYKSALEFLHQVREALGSANCKVLYLQIMATRELYAKDTRVNSKVLPLILEFEKSPDYANFNEEKTLEITKLKLLVKKETKAAQDKADAESKLKIEREKYIFDIVNKWGPFGVTLDELDKARPEWNVKEWEVFLRNKSVYVHHPAAFNYTKSNYPFANMKNGDTATGRVACVIVINGKVDGYYSYEIDFDGSAKGNEGISYLGPLSTMNKSNTTFTEKTGIQPVVSNFVSDGHSHIGYTWVYGDYRITEYPLVYDKKGKGVVRLLRYVQYVSPDAGKK